MKGHKKRRSVKAMTLMECIIAILVVGIAGTIMCRVATTAYNHLRNANHLNNKVNAEAPVASIQETNPAGVAASAQDVQITVTYGATTCLVDTKRYETRSEAALSNRDTENSMNADLHFYVVQETTAPAGP